MLCSSRRRKKEEEKQKAINFQKNGSLLVEELIASSRGIYNPFRTFSSHQILQATTHFDRNCVICAGRFYWYKGTIENRAVLIKKCNGVYVDYDNFYRDIAVSSMMSCHKNVLKILGCCLEFPLPVLVFEYPENGALAYKEQSRERIKPLSWSVRLKIAKEVANALTYLHTAFPKTIIHRDLNRTNIFLDENWTAKVSSFSLCIPIPEGEKGVKDIVCGTDGYIEPMYGTTGFVTEKVDVYNLGFLMLSLLTGKCGLGLDLDYYVEELAEKGLLLTKLIDPSMLNIPDHSGLQMEAFVELALRCVRPGEDALRCVRPGEDTLHVIDVAKELKHIEKQT